MLENRFAILLRFQISTDGIRFEIAVYVDDRLFELIRHCRSPLHLLDLLALSSLIDLSVLHDHS